MTSKISINGYFLATLLLLVVFGTGIYTGSRHTKEHYEQKEVQRLAQESEIDQKNLICEARVQRGKSAEIKSDYFIFERNAKNGDCEKFIDYINMPDDTEGVWLGF
jgi:hypothetical protein